MPLSNFRARKFWNLFLALAAAFFLIPSSKLALAQNTFSGVYSGSMSLTDGFARTIPLSLSLVVTNQDETTPNGTRKVIDGAFVVDDEGGPFAFSKVSLDLSAARIDMRYNRLRQDTTPSAPSAFRLIGILKENGVIEGEVSSGMRGMIGTFSVKHTSQTGLNVTPKYVGRWEGKLTYSDGYSVKSVLRLQASNNNATNPPESELDFTPGRVGSMEMEGVQYPFSIVTIDYLRRNFTFTHSAPQSGTLLSFVMSLDPNRGTLAGLMNSSNWGETARCTLEKISQ